MLVGAISTSGCGKITAATDSPRDGCEWTETIRVSKDDKLTTETEEQILQYNLTREKVCGK